MVSFLFFSLILIEIFQTTSYKVPFITRKDAIITTSFSSLSLLNNQKSSQAPIVVIGGCGYTGSDCVRTLVNDKRVHTRVVSRNPFPLENLTNPSLIDYKSADITIPKSLPDVLKDAKAVIVAVSAKKRWAQDNEQIQTFNDVNYLGLVNVAKVCITYEIPKLVVVSAFCSSCLDSNDRFDKSCGLKCENCKSKMDGESAIRELYVNSKTSTYTIIKPGVLTKGEKRGVGEIEINQDYSKSGMISRLDLADVCINTIDNKDTDKTSFTCYYKDTIQPVDVRKSLEVCTGMNKTIEECFFGSYFKDKKPKNLDDALKAPIKDTLFATGNEYSGSTYKQLFKHLKKDKDFEFDFNFDNSKNI
jgi:dTDP-4-dehydrorhamnose reductase